MQHKSTYNAVRTASCCSALSQPAEDVALAKQAILPSLPCRCVELESSGIRLCGIGIGMVLPLV